MPVDLDVFRALPDRGLYVFPIIAMGKTPARAGWQDSATRNWERIGWMHGKLNAGVMTGKFDEGKRLVGIDLDVKNGKDGITYMDLMFEPLPRTFLVRTPRGGRHYYFWTYRTDIGNSVDVFGPGCGIDVRGNNGYLVAPGSVTPEGSYTILDDAEIAELPRWLEDLLPKQGARPAGSAAVSLTELDLPENVARATAFLRNRKPAIQGQGGDLWAYQTAAMVADFGVQETTCQLLMMNLWNDRCEPPWGYEHLAEKVASGYRNRGNAIGCKAIDIDPTNWGVVPDGYVYQRPEEPAPEPVAAAGAAGTEADTRSLGRLKWVPWNEVPWGLDSKDLIKGTLGQGKLSVLYGESNSGKTFVSLDMAHAIATGRPWAGLKTMQGAVAYVAAEGAAGIGNRIEALRRRYAAEGAVPLALIPCQVDLLREGADTKPLIQLLHRAASEMGVKFSLVVIDTVSRAMAGGDENSSVDMGSFVMHAELIRVSTGAHVMLVHHSGKDASRGARGHSLLRAATDTELEIAEGVIRTRKQREMEFGAPVDFSLEVAELTVTEDGDRVTSCTVRYGDEAEKPAAERPALTDAAQFVYTIFLELAAESGGPVDGDKWRERVMGTYQEPIFPKGKDSAARTFRRIRDTLLTQGYVLNLSGRTWVLSPGKCDI